MENIVNAQFGPDRLVAFLDILGFKELLKRPDEVADYFNKVIHILDQIKATDEKKEIEYALISDSILLSFPYDNSMNNLNQFFIALGRIQADLCIEDIWLRGAITIGKIKIQQHKFNQIVFGQALSDAYVLEDKFAQHPRIILDPRIFDKVGKDRVTLKNELKAMNTNSDFFKNVIYDPMDLHDDSADIPGGGLTSDGVWINYLENVMLNREKLHTFIDLLKLNLYSGQQNFSKYKWVQNYALCISPMNVFRVTYGESAIEIFENLMNL